MASNSHWTLVLVYHGPFLSHILGVAIDIYFHHSVDGFVVPLFCMMDALRTRNNQKTCSKNGVWSPAQNPRDPITLSEDDWGVQSPPQQSI